MDVLGLKVLDRLQHEGWQAVLTGDPPTRLVQEAQYHADNSGEPFDPRRPGIDHLAFAAADRAELDEWQVHSDRHPVRVFRAQRRQECRGRIRPAAMTTGL